MNPFALFLENSTDGSFFQPRQSDEILNSLLTKAGFVASAGHFCVIRPIQHTFCPFSSQVGRDVRVAAGAVRLFPLRRDRLQLREDQRQTHLSGLAEAGAG